MAYLDELDEGMPRLGDVVAEKYRVERLLGVGGMGSVLEVRHVTLGHKVALKLLHPKALGDSESLARFFREARTTASLECEQVVRVHDVGTTDHGLPFLVMERLVGRDLGDMLLRIGAFPVPLALECIHQACLGVSEAHRAGIIHRDLKPSNLFLTRRKDGSALVKILDFGISKVIAEENQVALTQTRNVVGSPLYMSPEQVRDARRIDTRSDVWALGAILHELISGRPAFDGDTLPSVCASIVADEPMPIEREDVPEGLLKVIAKCLEKDAAKRVPSADELLQLIAPFRALYPPPSISEVDFQVSSSPESFAESAAFPIQQSNAPTLVEALRTSTPRGFRLELPATSAPTLTSGEPSLEPASRRWTLFVGVALAIGALGLGYGIVRKSPGERVTVVHPETHFVTIDSKPTGALLLESGHPLGRTPHRVSLRDDAPEKLHLELQLAGYFPYSLVIEPLPRDQLLLAELAALPSPTSDSPAPISSGTAATPKKPIKKSEPSVVAPKPSAAPDPSDIRLSR